MQHAPLQTLAALAAGLGCSVYLLLACLALVPQLAAFEREFLLDQRPLSLPRTLSLAVGVAGAAPALVACQWPSLLAAVCLGAWTLAEAAKQVWSHLLLHPGPLPGWPGAPGCVTLALGWPSSWLRPLPARQGGEDWGGTSPQGSNTARRGSHLRAHVQQHSLPASNSQCRITGHNEGQRTGAQWHAHSWCA